MSIYICLAIINVFCCYDAKVRFTISRSYVHDSALHAATVALHDCALIDQASLWTNTL